MNYYNEFDKDAADWLRDLIAAGLIPQGDVDERSIVDVRPDDLRGYTQCHFFAGIGGWLLALKLAGVPPTTQLWTGSCPCQPFSQAGKQKGVEDERHLWPVWYGLIRECRPPVVIGEQVAAAVGKSWLDLVQTDLEREGYTLGKTVLGAAGIGAPHIRKRLWFVADSERRSSERFGFNLDRAQGKTESGTQERERLRTYLGDGGVAGFLAHTPDSGRQPEQDARPVQLLRPLGSATERGYESGDRSATELSEVELGNNNNTGLEGRSLRGSQCSSELSVGATGVSKFLAQPHDRGIGEQGLQLFPEHGQLSENSGVVRSGNSRQRGGNDSYATSVDGNGFWGNADWIWCRDQKFRPVEPRTFPLAHGLPRSMGTMPEELRRLAEVAGLSQSELRAAKSFRKSSLRGYGNAIVPELAAEFIGAYFDAVREMDK